MLWIAELVLYLKHAMLSIIPNLHLIMMTSRADGPKCMLPFGLGHGIAMVIDWWDALPTY